jgi:hypothetical protein
MAGYLTAGVHNHRIKNAGISGLGGQRVKVIPRSAQHCIVLIGGMKKIKSSGKIRCGN